MSKSRRPLTMLEEMTIDDEYVEPTGDEAEMNFILDHPWVYSQVSAFVPPCPPDLDAMMAAAAKL